jgi:hypothetical protein
MTEPDDKDRRLDEVLKAGIVIAAMLFGYFIGRTSSASRVIGSSSPLTSTELSSLSGPLGQTLSLPGVNWTKNGRTLILALQTTCHFCTESAPFYQKLVRERSQFSNTKLLAVLPQSVEQSNEYLSNLGVSVDGVMQGSLRSIGVSGTPTLLLVNHVGTVTEAWTGKLQPEAEDQVLSRLEVC